MANTFIKLQTVTVGSGGAATINFTSIPQTYTDLKILLSTRANTSAVDVIFLTINGGSTAISSNRYLDGSGSAARSGSVSTYQGLRQPNNYTTSVFGICEFYIVNYTSSNNKTISGDSVTENNGSESYQGFTASLWANSAAITSISLTNTSSSFVEYSTATLYGIKSS